MIKVFMFRNGVGENYCGFAVMGHGPGVRGTDIVCAGVSALTQAAAMTLENYFQTHRILSNFRINAGDGFLSVKYKPIENRYIDGVIDSMLMGLREIQKQYPENLKIVDDVIVLFERRDGSAYVI